MALDVHLVTPEREVWAGTAQMVIARGTDGEVGILSGHVTSTEGDSRVDVLATQAEMAEEIDTAAAQARADELQARLRDEDDAGVRTELAKALARAGVGG